MINVVKKNDAENVPMEDSSSSNSDSPPVFLKVVLGSIWRAGLMQGRYFSISKRAGIITNRPSCAGRDFNGNDAQTPYMIL